MVAVGRDVGDEIGEWWGCGKIKVSSMVSVGADMDGKDEWRGEWVDDEDGLVCCADVVGASRGCGWCVVRMEMRSKIL